MLPNVSSALLGWTQPVLVKTVTTTTVDFVETEVVTGETVQAVVQPTKKTTSMPIPWTGHSLTSPCTAKRCWR